MTHETLGETHQNSPNIGDIVISKDISRRLDDPKGYKVENLGWSKGYGIPYGSFAARGVRYGGLYHFSVEEFELIKN